MENTEIKVTDCDKCPMYFWEHDQYEGGYSHCGFLNKKDESPYDLFKQCPLKTHSIIIKLASNGTEKV